MTLDEYLKKYNLTYKDIMELLGCSESWVSKLRRRISAPSLENSSIIIEWSRGEITLEKLTKSKVDPHEVLFRKFFKEV